MKQSTLGYRIRALRIQNNLTQAQLADRLNITDKAVSKWERDLSYPDIALFPRLADVLGTTADDLLRECTEEYRPSRLLRTFEMSRDIRLPLHIILGFAEIIRQNHYDPEMLQRYLDGIKVSGEYMLTLLNRIQTENDHPGEACPTAPEDLENDLHRRLSSAQVQPRSFDFTGKRILVVEDMAINREIAGEFLRQTGAVTEFAENGQICLDMVNAQAAGYYDMILMDIQMPALDGLETTRRLRRLPDRAKASIPIIAMTSNVSEKDRAAALEAGMNAFTEKPIVVDRLFETIEQQLPPARMPGPHGAVTG